MVSHVTFKNTAHHGSKISFFSWWTIKNQNIKEINNGTKNDENPVLHEEPFLNSHEWLPMIAMRLSPRSRIIWKPRHTNVCILFDRKGSLALNTVSSDRIRSFGDHMGPTRHWWSLHWYGSLSWKTKVLCPGCQRLFFSRTNLGSYILLYFWPPVEVHSITWRQNGCGKS